MQETIKGKRNTCRMMKVYLLLLLFTVSADKVSAQFNTNPPIKFGSCPAGKDTCSECYLALKKSLLSKDDNIRNLSLAFFPPRSNKPEFVTVTYKFDDESSQVWFWTHESSYLFFPLRTFQYLSLFFGKLETQVSQNVTLTLDAECNNTKPENLVLLTQRVSV